MVRNTTTTAYSRISGTCATNPGGPLERPGATLIVELGCAILALGSGAKLGWACSDSPLKAQSWQQFCSNCFKAVTSERPQTSRHGRVSSLDIATGCGLQGSLCDSSCDEGFDRATNHTNAGLNTVDGKRLEKSLCCRKLSIYRNGLICAQDSLKSFSALSLGFVRRPRAGAKRLPLGHDLERYFVCVCVCGCAVWGVRHD